MGTTFFPENWETATDSIPAGDRSWHITRITGISRLYEALLAKGDAHPDVQDERIPYWADLWHSAIGLARYLHARKELVRGKSILEIGCGLGLPGLAAAAWGASVTLTDYMDEALEMAGVNAAQNGIQGLNFVKMDWRKPDPSLKSDVVLASDVAYERRSFDVLPAAFKSLVKPGGVVLLSEPGRSYACVFFDFLADSGFRVESVEVPVDYRGISVQVKIHRLQAV